MNVSDAKVVMLKGEKGSDIASIEKTTSDGLVDSYTITLTDGSKHTFNVTNGSGIANIKKTGSSGLTDTYTVAFTNGDTSTFNVTNGREGRGITSIEKTGSSGIEDTYTINYSDGTKSTYNVVNADTKELTDKFDRLEGITTGKFVSGTACVAGNYYIADDKLYKCIANTDGTIPVTNTAYFKQTTVMNALSTIGTDYNILATTQTDYSNFTDVTLSDSIENYNFIGMFVYVYFEPGYYCSISHACIPKNMFKRYGMSGEYNGERINVVYISDTVVGVRGRDGVNIYGVK